MAGAGFDLTALLAPGLPPPAGRWAGFPRHNFVGGHNDPGHLPLEALIAATNAAAAAFTQQQLPLVSTPGIPLF